MMVSVYLSIYVDDATSSGFVSFVTAYLVLRLISCGQYLYEYLRIKCEYSRRTAINSFIATAISATSLLAQDSAVWRQVLLFAGILVDTVLHSFACPRYHCPLDKNHFVERIGLLTIILLGETIVALFGGSVHEDAWTLTGAFLSFVFIGTFWWVYFDSLHWLEKAKNLVHGGTVVFPHVLLCCGIVFMALLTGFAIEGEIDDMSFRVLAVVGVACFFLGKQIPVFYLYPTTRVRLSINTAAVLLVTLFSTYIPRIQFRLLGMTAGMVLYIILARGAHPDAAYVSDHEGGALMEREGESSGESDASPPVSTGDEPDVASTYVDGSGVDMV
ncbi:low temperature requirement A [Kipferlia bialata]|uniref:Low temperature requirement A n=1 Tax=Kipferlia bialata TaxID=797122 RepID=A0A391NWW3_9EUKA|nr:low temperature requirement A [Kipferlia bialata]|eukprot:g7130.t1